jgi:hypothetical protein
VLQDQTTLVQTAHDNDPNEIKSAHNSIHFKAMMWMSASGASAFRVDVVYDLFLNQERPFMLQYLVGIGAIVVHFLASSELSGLVGLNCVPSLHQYIQIAHISC